MKAPFLLLGIGGQELILILLVLCIILLPKVFYLITLHSTLKVVSPENRLMSPGGVWLLLIPVFSFVWHFVVVNNVADSIGAEADSMGLELSERRPAQNIGLAMCILNCLNFIPLLNILTGIASLICWIVYWVKVNTYKNMLEFAKNNANTVRY
jgi:hypothetical protein